MSSREFLILCERGTRSTSKGTAWHHAKTIALDATPVTGNVHLRLRDITDRMVSGLPAVAEDLVRLAAYVYAADQASERGDVTRFDYGHAWRRRFRFELPVRCPDIWRDERVTEELVRTLSFLSDDDYEFAFVPSRAKPKWNEYLEYESVEREVTGVTEVMLFSGGLDSLAGAVNEILVQHRKVALVSHRPVTKVQARQWRLVDELVRRAEPPSTAPFHVPVLVNKKKDLGRDFTQRTRSFLFVSFAVIVARLFGLDRVRFYENGIVSCNLPICAQVLGGRASRTTHPRVLRGFERLLSLLFERTVSVENPFFWHTRTEVIGRLRASGHAELAARSVSCAHTWHAKTDQPHCGTCSQCVDRRLAALAAGLTDTEDPASRYRVDLFTGHLEDVLDQTMVERIVGTAREVERITGPVEFLRKYGEASRLLRQLPGQSEEVVVSLLELHRRHARQVNGVIAAMLASRFREGRWHDLPPTCLLRMLAGPIPLPGEQHVTAPQDPRMNAKTEFVPTADDLKIIQCLSTARNSMIQTEIQVATHISRKTVGNRLREMQRCKVVCYPNGRKKGAALTNPGRVLASASPVSRVG